ncbi:MAG: HAD family phosphatase [Thermoguttaceae bacterium]|nr:HAD family phosphatase [Thermoguttaceae bacterium]
MSIRFVYFDLGNVLLRFSVHRMLSQLAEATGLPLEDVQTLCFDEGRYRGYEIGETSTEEFLDALCDAVGTKPNRDDLVRAINDIFWANDPVLPIVRKLAKLGVPRGILSNTNPLHWGYVEEAFPRIWDCFPEHKLASHLVRALKPFPEIYQIALDDAKKEIPDLQPSEVLFIDDLAPNVEGAKKFGFQTIHYVDFDSFLEQYKTFELPVPSRYLQREPPEESEKSE